MRSSSFLLFTVCVLAVSAASVRAHEADPIALVNYDAISEVPDASITLKVNQTSFQHSRSWVKLTIAGVSAPSASDWVALYAPLVATSALNSSAPAKLLFLSAVPGYLATGGGSWDFYLVNMRTSDLGFVLYRGGLEAPVAVARSVALSFANENEPLQVRLNLGRNGAAHEATVSWITRDLGTPQVLFGTSRGNLTHRVLASVSNTYKRSDLCDAPAKTWGFRSPGFVHQAVLPLRLLFDNDAAAAAAAADGANARVYYQVGDPMFGWTDVRWFRLPPARGAGVRVAVYGDMGTAQPDASVPWKVDSETNSLDTTARVRALSDAGDVSLVLHIGDLSYSRGAAQATWDFFGHQIEAVASRVPYLTCQGNHEVDCPNGRPDNPYPNARDSGGEGGVPSMTRYPPPPSANTTRGQQYYSYNWGDIHFLVMSTEVAYDRASAQYAFIEADLALVNRTRTPWLVVAGHRPMYVSSQGWRVPDGDQDVAVVLREVYEDLFAAAHVNLAIWGHHHSLQYTYPVLRKKIVKRGTVHAVIGNAGKALSPDVENPTPDFFQHVDATVFGYSIIDTASSPGVLEMRSYASHDNRLLYKIEVLPW